MLLFAVSCASDIAGKDNFFPLNVSATSEEESTVVCFSGLLSDSTFAIDRIQTAKEQEGIRINIYLTLLNSKKTGVLDYCTEIDSDTKDVYFGKDKTPVWSRPEAGLVSE